MLQQLQHREENTNRIRVLGESKQTDEISKQTGEAFYTFTESIGVVLQMAYL